MLTFTFLRCSTRRYEFSQENHDLAVASALRSIFNLFQGCHFNYIFMKGDKSTTFIQHIFNTFGMYVEAMDCKVTYSTLTKLEAIRNYRVNRFNTTSTHTCLVQLYVYSEEEFSSQQAFQQTLYSASLYLVIFGIWPNHNLLLGNGLSHPYYDAIRNLYLGESRQLVSTNLRGIVILVDYKNTNLYLICFPCYLDGSARFYDINMKSLMTLKDLEKLSFKLNSNFRQGVLTLTPQQAGRLVLNFSYCHFSKTYPQFFDEKVALPNRHDCVFEALLWKLNYTLLYILGGTAGQFKAQEYPMVAHDLNVLASNNLVLNAIMILTPHLHVDHLKLYMYQQCPRMTIKTVLNIGSRESWMTLSLSLVMMVLTSSLSQRVSSWNTKLYPDILNFLFCILDQPMIRNTLKALKINTRSIPAWLGLCMLALVAWACSYKGCFYSLVSKIRSPEWPSDVNDVIHDSRFLKVTVSGILSGKLATAMGSAVSRMLNNALAYKLKTQVDLGTLHETLCFRESLDFINEIFAASNLSPESRNIFACLQRRYSKAALIDLPTHADPVDVLIKSLHPNLVYLSPKIIRGVQAGWIWQVQKNFFAEHFITWLGRLSQSGYLEEINSRLFKIATYSYMVKHYSPKNVSNLQDTMVRFLYILNARRYPQQVEYTHLSWNQLKVLFLLILQISPAPMIVFAFEVCKHKIQSYSVQPPEKQ